MTSILGMFGSGASGYTERKMAQQNAKLIKREAAYKSQQAEQAKLDVREKAETIKSAQKAKIGASGVKLEGSPIESIMHTEQQAQKAINDITYWDKIQKWEAKHAAKITKKAGEYAFISGMISSGGQGAAYGIRASSGFNSNPTAGMKTKNPYSGETSGGDSDSGWSFNLWSLL